jgi:trimeric autotransporter adhesin
MTIVNLGRIKPVWKNEWAQSTSYVIDDIVRNGTGSYICINAHTSGSVFALGSDWELMAAGGIDGTDVGTGTSGQVLKTNSAGTGIEWDDDGLSLKADQSTTYTKTEVDTNIAGIVDSAPGTLDTLNELAAALGDDANHATTMTNLINAKLSPDGDGSQLTNLPAGGATDIDGLSDGYSAFSGATIAVGTGAMASATSAEYQSAFGYQAMKSITTGNSSVAMGWQALQNNTTGSNHTAVGLQSLNGVTTGSTNIGIGQSAGSAITTGSYNTIIGSYAGTSTLSSTVAIYAGPTERLKIDSTGMTVNGAAVGGASDIDGLSDGYSPSDTTIGIGNSALGGTTAGATKSIGIGQWAGKGATSGSGYNTCVGHYCFSHGASSGYHNTGMGNYTMMLTTSGSYNQAFGDNALQSMTTGSHNQAFGHSDTKVSATASNTCTLGYSGTSNLRCNDTSISSLSDRRDKTNIQDIPDSAGLELINKLRPITYHWDRREWYEDGNPDGSKIKADWRRWKPNSGLKQGFIAQEVQTAISGEKCLEDSMIVTDENPDKLEFAPQHLLTNAIKAIQQLSAENKALLARIEALENT